MELVRIDTAGIKIKSSLREELGDLSTLEASIRRHGLLFPITVGKDNVLVSGRRRLQACRNLGLTSIPAFRIDADSDSMKAIEIQCDENLCRLPLTAAELDKAIQLKKWQQVRSSGILGRVRWFFRRLLGFFRRKG